MKLTRKIISEIKGQRGATAVVIVLALVVLIGFAALAIDIGYLYSTKNELQNIADSAALAATGKLGNQYFLGVDPIDDVAIRDVAVDIGNKNRAGDKASISIDFSDIEIGKWDQYADPKFVPNDSDPFIPTGDEDAVRVTARRDSGPYGNGPVATFFARIFGADFANVSADAIADLSGASEVTEGGLPIPVGIGKARFDSSYCEDPIKFYPTNDLEACGGWHVYEDDKTKIKQDVLDGLLPGADPPWISPPAEIGDIFYFKGGTDNAAYTILKDVFDDKRYINDYWEDEANGIPKEWPVDGDLDDETWTTSVVVYDWEDCSNPNTSIPIIGFAKIRIYEICTATSDPSVQITGGGDSYPGGDPSGLVPGPPDPFCVLGEKQIAARIICKIIEPARGSGGEYGVIGSIPGLVE